MPYIPADKLIVVSTHIPFTNPLSDDPGVTTDNRASLFRIICEGRENVLSISGHTHTSYH